MANYNVDIEVALRGAAQLKTFRENLSKAADQAERLQNAVAKRGRTLGDVFAQQDKDRLKIQESLIKLEQKALGIDKEAIKNNNAILDQKADEFAQNQRLINQERVRQSIADKRRRVEEARGRQQAVGKGLENALIGGAFPLLFGQGAGAAVGGAAGGFGGGFLGGQLGFGLSLVGTAVGSQFDKLAEKAFELGKALNPLTADTEDIISAVGKSNTKFASLVQELETAGESARALELATSELEKVVGVDGVEALELFSARIVDVQNDFAVLTTKIVALVAAAANALTGETPAVRQARDRAAAVFEARQSGDPEIVAAVAALDALGVDPKARIAQQERIVELLNKGTESERERIRLNELAQKQGKDQARMVRASTAVTALQVQLLESGVHASSEQGAVIRRRIADLQEEEAITKAYKDFAKDAISKDTLRAKLANARVTRERAYAQILKDVNDRTVQLAEKDDRAARRQQKAIDRRIKAVERELERTDKAFDRASSQLDAITQKHEDKMAFEREYSRLIQEGSTPAAARQAVELKKQVLELERGYDKLLDAVDAQIFKTEASLQDLQNQKGVTTEYQEQVKALDELKKRRGELEGKKGTARSAIEEDLAPETFGDKIKGEMDRVQAALNDLLDPANQVILAAQAIGNAFSESFRGLITGSMSAQEALANLFQRTADHFADMAAQMIAKQIQMKILGIAFNFLGGAAAGGGASSVPGSAYGDMSVAGPDFFSGGMIPGYAEGGYVSGPTRALVGEGGQGEYVIPENKMRESMARYSRGARGSSVIPDAGASGTSGEGGGTAVAAPIDVRYTVERINSVDYVTADQFQRGLQSAADQGAKKGEQQTLKRLQLSGSTRKRIGL